MNSQGVDGSNCPPLPFCTCHVPSRARATGLWLPKGISWNLRTHLRPWLSQPVEAPRPVQPALSSRALVLHLPKATGSESDRLAPLQQPSAAAAWSQHGPPSIRHPDMDEISWICTRISSSPTARLSFSTAWFVDSTTSCRDLQAQDVSTSFTKRSMAQGSARWTKD